MRSERRRRLGRALWFSQVLDEKSKKGRKRRRREHFIFRKVEFNQDVCS